MRFNIILWLLIFTVDTSELFHMVCRAAVLIGRRDGETAAATLSIHARKHVET